MARLRELAERDPEMMSKEVMFSAVRFSQRLAAVGDMAFGGDETHAAMPAVLRKKVVQGKGKGRGKPSA